MKSVPTLSKSERRRPRRDSRHNPLFRPAAIYLLLLLAALVLLTGCAQFSPTCRAVYADTLPDYQGEHDDLCGFDYMKGVRS